jgi:hypothetical protein
MLSFSPGKYRIVAVPDYNCGQILEIKNLFITWQTNNTLPGCNKQNQCVIKICLQPR